MAAGLDVDVRGNFGSHSLRKTWGYHQRVHNNAQLPVLMDAFGHTTQRQTLQYLGIEEKEIAISLARLFYLITR